MSTPMSSQHILQKAQITFSHPLLIKSFFSRREKSSGCSPTLSVPFNKIFLLPPPFSTMASTGKPAEHPDEGPILDALRSFIVLLLRRPPGFLASIYGSWELQDTPTPKFVTGIYTSLRTPPRHQFLLALRPPLNQICKFY